MRLLTGLSLGKKTILLASAGLLIGLGVFSYLGMRAVGQAVDTMLEDRLALAQLTADYIDDTLSHVVAEVESAAKAEPGAGDDGFNVERLKAVASRLSIEVSSVFGVSSDGEMTWGSHGTERLDLSSYPTLMKTLKDGASTVSGLVPSPAGGAPVVLIASGAGPDSAGKRVALVVAVDVAKSSIAGLIQPVRLGQTGYVEILDQNGIVVARTLPGPLPEPFEISDHKGRFGDLIAAGRPTRGVCHSCHEPGFKVERRDVLAFAPLAEANWGVAVRQSEPEALAPISQLRQNFVAAAIGMFLVAAVFVTVITRGVVGRIGILTSASKRIAAGDLVTPIALTNKDELGVLAGAFDEMRTKLGTSRDELEQRTNELSALLAVSEELALVPGQSDLETGLGRALERTQVITGADAVGILLRSGEKESINLMVWRGPGNHGESLRGGIWEGILAEVVKNGHAIQIKDMSVDPKWAGANRQPDTGLKGLAAAPLRSDGGALGVLIAATREAREFSSHDVRLLESVGGQVAIALDNVRLNQEIQHNDEMRRELLREVLAMQEEDRRRIARELHDETSQVIASLTANLEAIVSVLPAGSEKAFALARKTQALSVKILDEIHRLIYELRPSLLDDMGLVSAARWLAENNLEANGVLFEFKTNGKVRRLSPETEITLFRVIQEGMNNIVRHAGAKKAGIVLYFRKKSVLVKISDDGRGFDVDDAINAKDRPRGLGLLGMRERVELLKGKLTIESHPGGGGTVVGVVIPVEEDPDGKDQSTGG